GGPEPGPGSEQPVAYQEGAGQRRQNLRDRLERLIKPEHRALLVAFHAVELCRGYSIQYRMLRGLGTPREHEGCAKCSVERLRHFVFAYHCLGSFPPWIAGNAASCPAPSGAARCRKKSEGGSDLYSSRNQAG